MIRLGLYRAFEGALHLGNRLRGVGVHPDPGKHFGPGGLEAAVAYCERVNADFPAYLRPPADTTPRNVERRPVRPPRRDVTAEELTFDSPRPGGRPRNDRVQVRVWRPAGSVPGDPVLMFHHPVYQHRWRPWEWFLHDLMARLPVAFMAAPYHFARIPPGWFAGEGIINPNPVRIYQAIRQWVADERALRQVLEQRLELMPAVVAGFSLGAFQAKLAASIGELKLPIVSIASTNRYAWGLTHGTLGGPLLASMARAGVTSELLFRMADSLQLERFVEGGLSQPVLLIRGVGDRVDPAPSGERLERAVRPDRAVHIEAGHATMIFHRREITAEIERFLATCGVACAAPRAGTPQPADAVAD